MQISCLDSSQYALQQPLMHWNPLYLKPLHQTLTNTTQIIRTSVSVWNLCFRIDKQQLLQPNLVIHGPQLTISFKYTVTSIKLTVIKTHRTNLNLVKTHYPTNQTHFSNTSIFPVEDSHVNMQWTPLLYTLTPLYNPFIIGLSTLLPFYRNWAL